MGLNYSLGICNLVLHKNRIAPGEILIGSIALHLTSPIKYDYITVSLNSYELTRNVLYKYKDKRFYSRYFTKIVSHPILDMKLTSANSPTYYTFQFKLPKRLQPSLSISKQDFELAHTYHIETCIQALGKSYISRHEIDVKSLSYEYDELEYSPPPPALISHSKSPYRIQKVIQPPQRPGISRVSWLGVMNKYIDLDVCYEFTHDPGDKYIISYGIRSDCQLKNRLNMKSKYSGAIYEEKIDLSPNKKFLRFLISMPVENWLLPCYKGKFCSITNQVFFKVERVGRRKNKVIYEETKYIPIKSSYHMSRSYQKESEILNSFVIDYNDKYYPLAIRILLKVVIPLCISIYMYLNAPPDEDIRMLLDEEYGENQEKEGGYKFELFETEEYKAEVKKVYEIDAEEYLNYDLYL